MQNPNLTQNPAPTVNQSQQQTQPETPVNSNRPGPYDNYALTSFLMGTFSIITSLVVYPGLAFGIMSIVFGLRGKQSTAKSKLAKIGIILGVIGLISSIFWGVLNLYLSAVGNS